MTIKQRVKLSFILDGCLSDSERKWCANLAGSYLGSVTRLLSLAWWGQDKVDSMKWRQKDDWMEVWGERKSKRKSDRAWGKRQSRVKTLGNGLFAVLSKETWGLTYLFFVLSIHTLLQSTQVPVTQNVCVFTMCASGFLIIVLRFWTKRYSLELDILSSTL